MLQMILSYVLIIINSSYKLASYKFANLLAFVMYHSVYSVMFSGSKYAISLFSST